MWWPGQEQRSCRTCCCLPNYTNNKQPLYTADMKSQLLPNHPDMCTKQQHLQLRTIMSRQPTGAARASATWHHQLWRPQLNHKTTANQHSCCCCIPQRPCSQLRSPGVTCTASVNTEGPLLCVSCALPAAQTAPTGPDSRQQHLQLSPHQLLAVKEQLLR